MTSASPDNVFGLLGAAFKCCRLAPEMLETEIYPQSLLVFIEHLYPSGQLVANFGQLSWLKALLQVPAVVWALDVRPGLLWAQLNFTLFSARKWTLEQIREHLEAQFLFFLAFSSCS